MVPFWVGREAAQDTASGNARLLRANGSQTLGWRKTGCEALAVAFTNPVALAQGRASQTGPHKRANAPAWPIPCLTVAQFRTIHPYYRRSVPSCRTDRVGASRHRQHRHLGPIRHVKQLVRQCQAFFTRNLTRPRAIGIRRDDRLCIIVFSRARCSCGGFCASLCRPHHRLWDSRQGSGPMSFGGGRISNSRCVPKSLIRRTSGECL